MKLTNLRRSIAAILAAAGVFVTTADAQNLVVNGGFENVDISAIMGGYNAVQLLDWTAPTGTGYAYSHDGSLNSSGSAIPDYANGGPLAGGGSFYFTSNANSPDNDVDNAIFQDVDVSGVVAGGEVPFSLSAYFSSFASQGDFGTVSVEFLDAAGMSLGVTSIVDSDTTTWTRESAQGVIPASASVARVSAYGTALGGGPDGYIDNISLSVVPEPAGLGLSLIGLGGISLWRRRRSRS